jgi:hypothetical protein
MRGLPGRRQGDVVASARCALAERRSVDGKPRRDQGYGEDDHQQEAPEASPGHVHAPGGHAQLPAHAGLPWCLCTEAKAMLSPRPSSKAMRAPMEINELDVVQTSSDRRDFVTRRAPWPRSFVPVRQAAAFGARRCRRESAG